MDKKSSELLEKVNMILKEEGIDNTNAEIDTSTMLNDYLLPGLQNSKDILTSIYSFKSRSRDGIVGKFKTKVQSLIINTVINVIEKQSMKQQKFNEITFRAIEALAKENKELKEKLKN